MGEPSTPPGASWKTVTLSSAETGDILVRATATGTIPLGSMADVSNKIKFTAVDNTSTYTTDSVVIGGAHHDVGIRHADGEQARHDSCG